MRTTSFMVKTSVSQPQLPSKQVPTKNPAQEMKDSASSPNPQSGGNSPWRRSQGRKKGSEGSTVPEGSDRVLCQIGRILLGFLQREKKSTENWGSLFLFLQHMHSTGPVRTPDPGGLSSGLVEVDHSLASLCFPPFAHPPHVC